MDKPRKALEVKQTCLGGDREYIPVTCLREGGPNVLVAQVLLFHSPLGENFHVITWFERLVFTMLWPLFITLNTIVKLPS